MGSINSLSSLKRFKEALMFHRLATLILLLLLAPMVWSQSNDRDGDAVIDAEDNCLTAPNTDQSNFDQDLFGDACDIDDDNDGLIDDFDPAPFDAEIPTDAELRTVTTNRKIVSFGTIEGMLLGQSLDSESNQLAVGAPFSTSSGQIEVYSQSDSGDYQLVSVLTGDENSRTMGADVDLSGDAEFIFTADGNASVNATQSGRVLAYGKSSSTWDLFGGDVTGESTYSFMQRVRGSGDGVRMVAGSPSHSNQTVGLPDNVGYLRTFDLVDEVWTESAPRLQGENTGDMYGHTLELTRDGNTLFVGAPRVDDPNGNAEIGAIYQYRWSSGQWVLEASIVGDQPNARLGTHISLSSDETTLAVSEPGAAKVHIFDLTKTDWASSRQTIDQPFHVWEFGHTVDLNAHGNVILIGTYSQQAFVYFNDGANWRSMADTSHIFGEPSSNYGRHVKVNVDGTQFFIASPEHNYKVKRGGLVETIELDYDTDLDGVGDSSDQLPTVSLQGRKDTDRDGLPDECDTFCELDGLVEDIDDDNDGIADDQDAFPLISSTAFVDTDQDGRPDYCATYCADLGLFGDDDDDGDGVVDWLDAFPLDPRYARDTDNDSIADAVDDDRDGDGVLNELDAFPDDSTEQLDSDEDGVGDNADEFPEDPAEQLDSDNDGVGNNADTDRDGDGVSNDLDAMPDDPTEDSDNDQDGLGDFADFDDDNDGIWDELDSEPTIALSPESQGRMMWRRVHRIEGTQDGGYFGRSVDIADGDSTFVVAANKIDESDVPGARVMQLTSAGVNQIGGDIIGPTQAPRVDRVAISSNANTVVINDGGSSVGNTQTGALNVFDLTENDWLQRGDSISRPSTYAFLSRLTVNVDGSIVGMGSTTNASPGGFAGFTRFNGTEWELLDDYIEGTDSDEVLSWGMATNDLGDVIALGAPQAEGASGTPVNAGKVMTYRYLNGGWEPLGSTVYGAAVNGYFGSSVALNSAGNILAVGSDSDDRVAIYRLERDEWILFGAVTGACPGGLTQNWRSVKLDSSGFKLSVSRQCNGYETHDELYYFDGLIWRSAKAESDTRIGGIYQEVETALSSDGLLKLIGVPGFDSAGLTDNGAVEVYSLVSDRDGDGVADDEDASPDNPLYFSDQDNDTIPELGSETIEVDVARGATLTQGHYSGLLRLDFVGKADSNVNDGVTEDAFYYVAADGGVQFSEWLALLGDSTNVICFDTPAYNSDTSRVIDLLVFVEGEGFVNARHQPEYRPTSQYSVVVDVGADIRRLSFAHADCGFWDNEGGYSVTITEVEAIVDASNTTLSITDAFKSKGLSMADSFPQDPAASIDSDNDGAPDAWNPDATDEIIANSLLVLDDLPFNPDETIDADDDGYGANEDPDDSDPNVVPEPDAIFSVQGAEVVRGQTFTISMTTDGVTGLGAIDVSFGYDSSALELVSVSLAPALSDWNYQSFSPEPGIVNVSAFTVNDYSGDGDLILLEFRFIDAAVSETQVTVESLLLNGGQLDGDVQPSGGITQIATYAVSGAVSYWFDESVGVHSTLSISDGVTATTTAEDKTFVIPNVPAGPRTLSISIDESDNGAIRAYDSSLVLGMAVGAIAVDDETKIVADVDRSQNVNSADARLILRYVVGLDQLPFANQDGMWHVTPAQYDFEYLSDDIVNANFVASLIGDVSGNWLPVSGEAGAKAAGKPREDSVSPLSAVGPIAVSIAQNETGGYELTFELEEPGTFNAVELEIDVSPGLEVVNHESLLGAGWFTDFAVTDQVISFGASAFPASEVSQLLKLVVNPSSADETLNSIRTYLNEDRFDQVMDLDISPLTADSDGDGVVDEFDAFPNDPSESLDSDDDGIGNNTDTDDDGDGVEDSADLCPLRNGNLTAVNAENDILDIVRFEFCAVMLEEIPTLQFTLELSSNFTGDSLQLLFWLEGQDQTWITINRDPETGLFTRSLELNPQAVSGTYAVRAVRLFDQDGIEVRLNEGQLNELGADTKSVLANPNADLSPPGLTSFVTDGWIIDGEGQPTLSVDLNAADIGSGLQPRVIIELLSPTGTSVQRDGYFDENGSVSITFVLSPFTSSGDYVVNTVRIYDLAGNSTFSYEWLSDNPQVFTLDNPQSDSTAPSLKQFELSASFDNESDRPVINVTGTAEDDISGVQSVYLRLRRPGGGNIDKWIVEGQSAESLDFVNGVALTTQFTPGNYEVDYLRLQDVAQNQSYFSVSDIDALEEPSIGSINVYFPTESEVLGGKSVVEASASDDFVFGSNASDDTLMAGDGDDKVYSGDGDDEVDAGDGNDEVIGGSGEGDDIYRGGLGVDTVIYSSAINPITVDLEVGFAEGADIGFDSLSGFESVVAGQGPDVLRGDSSSNVLEGGEGSDTLFASPGADMLDGQAGADEYAYASSEQSNLDVMDTVVLSPSDRILFESEASYLVANRPSLGDSLASDIAAIYGDDSIGSAFVLLSSNGLEGSTDVDAWVVARVPADSPFNGLVIGIKGEISDTSLSFVTLADSDADSTPDLLSRDDDGDGLSDLVESQLGTNPTSSDSDSDQLDDSIELEIGTNPLVADSDGDGLADGTEAGLGTNPLLADTDNDGFSDGEEVSEGTSPTDGDDQPLSGSRVWLYQLILDSARANAPL